MFNKENNMHGMLVLTRNVGQQIYLGDDIVVRLVGMSGQQAAIGILAPRELSVFREEIYHRIKAERLRGIAYQLPPAAERL